MNILLREGLTGTIRYNSTFTSVVTGDIYSVDAIVTLPTSVPNTFFIAQSNYDSSATASGKRIEVHDLQVIDITEDFEEVPTDVEVREISNLYPNGIITGTVRVGSKLSQLNAEKIDKLKDFSPYLIYLSASQYEVWYPMTSGKWGVFAFYRDVDAGIKKDSWRISNVRVCDLKESDPLTTRTESNTIMLTSANSQWEYAFLPEGAADFMGGFHGDEILQNILFAMDGKPITLDSTINRKLSGYSFEMVQLTYLYDPLNPATKLADMYCRHIISKDGVRVKFHNDWKVNRNMSTSYAGMLPALRSATTTTKGRFMDEPIVRDISTTSHGRPGKISLGAELWNDTNNISMSVEFDDDKFFDGWQFTTPLRAMWITDNAAYNKVYPTRINGVIEPVVSGDVWEASFIYKIHCR